MRSIGLRLKILAGLMLISFCVMSVLVLTIRAYLSDALESQLIEKGEFIARTISEQSISPLLTRKQLELQMMLYENKKSDSDIAYIYIIDPSGDAVSHTFDAGFPSGLKEGAGREVNGYALKHVQFGSREIIDIAVPVMEKKLGRLHVGMSHQNIKSKTNSILFTVSLTITLLFMLAAVIMWVFLERIAIRPVKSLEGQITLLGKGDFEAHSSIDTADEIGMLSHAFNDMRNRLNAMYVKMEGRTAELARLNEQLEQLATTDGLTGLYNHRHFYDRLAEEVKRAKRYQHPLTLIMGDIDHFKRYNDARGHVTGDKVLKIIAGLISENARESDLAARYGGEEIAVILPETGLETGRLVAERMRSIIESSAELSSLALAPGEPITMSFGVAQLDEATDTPKGFVRLADTMLYRAKESGRNRVEC